MFARVRPIFALGAGLLIGAFAGPMTTGAATTNAVQTRHVSCGPTDFQPIDSGSTFTLGSSQIIYRTSGGGSSSFRCSPKLPHNAVVTKLYVLLADYDPAGQAGECYFRRQSLNPAVQGLPEEMAYTPDSGISFSGGRVAYQDLTINFPQVKNGTYFYYLSCTLTTNPNAGLIGASITFNIDPANG